MAMGYLTLPFFISSFLIIPLLTVAQQPNLVKEICISERGNYTYNSSYKASLDSLLSSFSNTTVDYGFYNSSAGEVKAIALCRGDLTPDTCRSCVNTSSHEIRRLCPNYKEAIIHYDTCMLRYSNRSIFSMGEYFPLAIGINPRNFSDVQQAIPVLQKLLRDLKYEAASGGPLRKYATGEALVDSETIYALVQCTPDLPNNQCTDCLEIIKESVPATVAEGKRGLRALGPSCNFRYETYLFYQPPPGAPSPSPSASPSPSPSPSPTANLPSPPPSTSTAGKGKDNTRRTAIIIVIPTIISVMLIICICICIFLTKRKQRENVDGVDELMTVESLEFDLNSIRVATDNFSDANKLGEGGFGAVYKGKLPNGQDIAVKRLARASEEGELQFKNELPLVAKLQHRNLVRFLGFCLEGIEKLLIYEFVPNGSLDYLIFDPIRRSQLDWERSYKIIKGIARGLLYLHEDSRLQIVHLDLKASNILLDAKMNPKISEFGMARLLSVDQTQGKTSKIMGTYGYMAPEYAMHGNFSTKSDVYSFGVLTLEIISGQKNNCFRNGENTEDLMNYAWKSWSEGTVSNLIDPILRSGSRSEIMRCVHIGLLCVQENAADRPTMASVAAMFSSNSVTLPAPSRPTLFMHDSVEQEIPLPLESNFVVTESHENIGQMSINEISITELSPR